MSPKKLSASAVLLLGICTLSGAVHAQSAAPGFALHDGDRVTFYGDSITEQRQYTEDVEAYVLTRYPGRKVSFHNAGVGGDRVTGGQGGPIDLRLNRDVFAWHPDVVTIMLGMNDSFYRPDDPGIFSTYASGYRHIVEAMQKNNPQVRITLIEPSPYDDVTREPRFAGGSNNVLLKYSAFLTQLASELGAKTADFNTPLTTVMRTVNKESPALARQIIPDRIHPQQGGHWIMAESLLKSWNAPSLVTSVAIHAGKNPHYDASNTDVTGLTRGKGEIASRISWVQADKALPLPLPPLEVDPVLALVVGHSDLIAALDQETLQVFDLLPGTYDLFIDGRKIGSFPAAQLAQGINLATMETPMLEQARLVAFDTEKVNNLESARFEIIRSSTTVDESATAEALADAYMKGVERQRADARPVPHHFELELTTPSTPSR